MTSQRPPKIVPILIGHPVYQVKQSLQKLCTVLENKGNWKKLVNNFREFFFIKIPLIFNAKNDLENQNCFHKGNYINPLSFRSHSAVYICNVELVLAGFGFICNLLKKS